MQLFFYHSCHKSTAICYTFYMEIYTQTPQLPKGICKILLFLFSNFLRYGAVIVTLGIWWLYNWYYALSTFLLAFILIGILRSKLLHSSIPKVQQEFTYADKEIAAWYLYRYVCPSKVE